MAAKPGSAATPQLAHTACEMGDKAAAEAQERCPAPEDCRSDARLQTGSSPHGG